jgi:hypothetical protein
LTPALRRKLLCGLDPDAITARAESAPPTIDPGVDNVELPASLPLAFDIDSCGGWASSLSVARQGLQWLATRPATSTLTSSLHLDPLLVEWRDPESQRLHYRHVPVCQVPHLPLGRLRGFEAMELFVLFPRLYHPQRSAWVLTNDEYCEWMDQLLLPALRQTQAPEAIVRLPGSGQEAILRGSAAATEGATASDHHLPRI